MDCLKAARVPAGPYRETVALRSASDGAWGWNAAFAVAAEE